MKQRICLYCKRDFVVKSTWPSQKFCSRECGFKGVRKTPEFYSIKTECGCGCGEIILNPDDHFRYRKYLKNHINRNGTHPRQGIKESEEHLEFRLKQIFKSFKGKETCLEIQLYKYLDSLNILYEKQKQIGRTRPDAYIESLNLCVYADGDYWHTGKLNEEKDKRCNESLLKRGYNVVRLPSGRRGITLDLSKLEDIFRVQDPSN